MLFGINIKNVKIPSYPSIYENLYKLQKKNFGLKYIFRIKFKIPILDLILLPKTVFHLKGYTTVIISLQLTYTDNFCFLYDQDLDKRNVTY